MFISKKKLDRLISYAENRGYVKRASEDAQLKRLQALEKHDYTIPQVMLEARQIVEEKGF